MDANGTIAGEVKWFDLTRGFGFIRPDDHTQPDRFVHISGWDDLKRPEPGQRVTFVLEQGRKGLEARNVQVDEPQHAA